MEYWSLNEIFRRRARVANIAKPELHSLRRAFALNFLRNGGDIFTLQKLMGHSDLQVMRRYLAQTTEDMQAAHNKVTCTRYKGSPADLLPLYLLVGVIISEFTRFPS
jgi:site-specific recombinase XerD